MSKEFPVYSDVDNRFDFNAFTGALNKKIDIHAVRQSIINLLQTEHYDRCFHPEIGISIQGLMWQLSSVITFEILKEEVKTLLAYEPRIELIDLDISILDPSREDVVYISMAYNIRAVGLTDMFSFAVTRVR
jgi:phage baseplate assembly protein W